MVAQVDSTAFVTQADRFQNAVLCPNRGLVALAITIASRERRVRFRGERSVKLPICALRVGRSRTIGADRLPLQTRQGGYERAHRLGDPGIGHRMAQSCDQAIQKSSAVSRCDGCPELMKGTSDGSGGVLAGRGAERPQITSPRTLVRGMPLSRPDFHLRTSAGCAVASSP